MVKTTVTLPYNKETPGAVVYALSNVKDGIIGSVYVRKDKLAEAGHAGPWPRQITLTVETA